MHPSNYIPLALKRIVCAMAAMAVSVSPIAQQGSPRSASGNSQAALDLLRDSAAKGNAEAEYLLALRLLEGSSVQRNPSEAARLLASAASRNHAESRYQLALLHLQGLGVEKSNPDAALLLRLNANGRPGPASFRSAAMLGAMVLSGNAGPRNLEEVRNLMYHASQSPEREVASYAKDQMERIDSQLQRPLVQREAQDSGAVMTAAIAALALLLISGSGPPSQSAGPTPEYLRQCERRKESCHERCRLEHMFLPSDANVSLSKAICRSQCDLAC